MVFSKVFICECIIDNILDVIFFLKLLLEVVVMYFILFFGVVKLMIVSCIKVGC